MKNTKPFAFAAANKNAVKQEKNGKLKIKQLQQVALDHGLELTIAGMGKTMVSGVKLALI
ncbi:hypothetical protein P4S65_07475 [Pseudoalteromonas sp. B131b]|uniref:hypothetical protein n=1 Tax=Pseudoalteromonas sp. B131b TaxID=630493 RepID=UPI00301DBDA1